MSRNCPGSSLLVTGSAPSAGSQAGPWPVESRLASGVHEPLSSSRRRFLRTDVAPYQKERRMSTEIRQRQSRTCIARLGLRGDLNR